MRLAVFCGSSVGNDPAYAQATRALGATLGKAGIGIVYGGASVGLMGVLADAAIEHGAKVIGVLPQSLKEKELAHGGLSELRIVASMHERKAMMAELADGFVALPGGIGTFEELFEVWTWGQLGYHRKPCAVLNVAGFYDGLLGFLDGVTRHGFVRENHRRMLLVANDPHHLIQLVRGYEPPKVPKWVGAENR